MPGHGPKSACPEPGANGNHPGRSSERLQFCWIETVRRLPDGTIGRVPNDQPGSRETVSEDVRPNEVPGRACVRAFLQQALNEDPGVAGYPRPLHPDGHFVSHKPEQAKARTEFVRAIRAGQTMQFR